MDYTAKIVAVLQELKSAAQGVNSSQHPGTDELTERYDMLFLGERLNIIAGVELFHALNTKFGLSITLDEFLRDIPAACAELGMDTQPLVRLEDAGTSNPKIADYSIILF